MKKIFVLAITLTAIASGSKAFAEADLNPNIFRPAAPTPAATSPVSATTERPVGSTTGSNATRIQPIQGSINPGSQEGQKSQSGGAGVNAAVGSGLMAAGAALMSNPKTVPPGVVLMGMGILAMMQAKEDSGAAGQSAATGFASNVNDGSVTPGAVDPNGTGAFAEAKIKEGQAKLGEAGYKMTSKGLTGPDGSFIPAKAFSSPSSMAAAGMSPTTIAAVQEGLADAQAGASGSAARVSGVGINTGGGGGSGGGMTEDESNGSSESGTGVVNPFDIGAEKKGSLVAGKTVMFDGEPIGVRGQNIFDMVHVSYQKKREGKHFIETENDVSARSPASVKPPKK
jgi:hypothetical protein